MASKTALRATSSASGGPLERLFETVAGVMRVDVAPLGIADGAPGTVISQLSVVVIYQLDSAVITA